MKMALVRTGRFLSGTPLPDDLSLPVGDVENLDLLLKVI
jgi:hypothetical protein